MKKYFRNDDGDFGKGKKKKRDWKLKRHIENRREINGKNDREREQSEAEHEFSEERNWDRNHSGSW